MSLNPSNDLNKFGHSHDDKGAEIIPFPIQNPEVQTQETLENTSRPDLRFMSAAAIFSGVVVGIPAYNAYKSLEGNDVLYANAVGGAMAASLAVLGVTKITKRFTQK